MAHDEYVTTTQTTQDPTTMTPEEIDSILFPLWAERWKIGTHLGQYRELVALRLFPGSKFTDRRSISGSPSQLASFCQRIQEIEARLAEIRSEMDIWQAEFERRGGWTRYILCGNNNGHLHYDSCHTLKWTTKTLLVPQASGLDSSAVVGRFGTVACSKCFAGAPV